jgi:hypothetical protein
MTDADRANPNFYTDLRKDVYKTAWSVRHNCEVSIEKVYWWPGNGYVLKCVLGDGETTHIRLHELERFV